MNKIDSNEKYGIKFVYVHGIGRENVKKVVKIVEEITVEIKNSKVNVNASENAINVRISFEKD